MRVDYILGTDFGDGIDSLSFKKRQKAVFFEKEPSKAGSASSRTEYRLTLATSYSELARSLGVSFSASVGNLLYGSISVKSEVLREVNRVQSALHIVLQCRKTLAHKVLSDESLPKERIEELQKNPGSFRQKYGDFYVEGITSGGEFIVVISVRCSDLKQVESVRNSLSAGAKFGPWRASVDASESTHISNILSQYEQSISFKSEPSVDLQVRDLETALKAMEQFLKNIEETPSGVFLELLDYKSLFSDFQEIDLVDKREFLERAVIYYEEILARIKILDRLKLYSGSHDVPVNLIQAIEAKLSDYRDACRKEIKAAVDGFEYDKKILVSIEFIEMDAVLYSPKLKSKRIYLNDIKLQEPVDIESSYLGGRTDDGKDGYAGVQAVHDALEAGLLGADPITIYFNTWFDEPPAVDLTVGKKTHRGPWRGGPGFPEIEFFRKRVYNDRVEFFAASVWRIQFFSYEIRWEAVGFVQP